jgi:acetyl esterase/lipase
MVNKIWAMLWVLFWCPIIADAQQVISLYDKIPNSITSNEVWEKSDTTATGRIRTSLVTTPTLTAFFPAKDRAQGVAVIICPGGGYSYLVMNQEGTDVAEEFVKKGIAAFVLKYRLPNDKIMRDKTIGPLQDAQQAIKLVRERAQEWNIDTAKIGIMGFSAGGHLASIASTHFNDRIIENKNNTSLRPDFSILVYPVISFSEELAHKGSRRSLLGRDTSSITKIDFYSNEKQVTPATPPTFLLHATDDKTVLVGNSISYYQSLIRNGVKAEIHIYFAGGHGFGLKNKMSADQWLDRCFNWMVANKWIKPE